MTQPNALIASLQHSSPSGHSIGIVGLGYVGLPLACLLAKKYRVVGFDISQERIDELSRHHDRTREVEDAALLAQPSLAFTSDATALRRCPVVIVCVPTPVDTFRIPDLTPLEKASQTVGANLQDGSIVVFESTVYPGVTEDICGPILAKASGLVLNQSFYLGYSPERVNPGDRRHTIDKITKVVSGSTPEVAQALAEIYGSVITAGIHVAPTIKTAEAAKVIENTQRDINIALVNELAMLFDRIGLDTQDVLTAAKTKWNFLDFAPGLVGGHCIGVDPYYLTHLARSVGFHTEVITAGRRINDSVGTFVGQKTLNLLLQSGPPVGRRPVVAILGVTFKENVPDLRNTKVMDVGDFLLTHGVDVYFVDPVADPNEFHHEYKRRLTPWEDVPPCDALIYAVRHEIFARSYGIDRLAQKLVGHRVIVDIKGAIDRAEALNAGVRMWRL